MEFVVIDLCKQDLCGFVELDAPHLTITRPDMCARILREFGLEPSATCEFCFTYQDRAGIIIGMQLPNQPPQDLCALLPF